MKWTLQDVVVKLRNERGWRQADLATHAQVAPATIARFEQGEDVNFKSVTRIVQALGFKDVGDAYALIPESATHDAPTQELVRLVMQLDVEARNHVLGLVRLLSDELRPAQITNARPPRHSTARRASSGRTRRMGKGQ